MDYASKLEKLGENIFCGACLIIFFVIWGWLLAIVLVISWLCDLIKEVKGGKGTGRGFTRHSV